MKPVRMAAMFLATLLVIYPLSIGPAYVLDFKLRAKPPHPAPESWQGPSETFILCYWPILWLAEKRPAIMSAVDGYIRLWLPPQRIDFGGTER